MAGIRLYYRVHGTDRIESAVAISKKGSAVYFKDGDWNPADECYVTRRQCERATGVPPADSQEAVEAARRGLASVGLALERLKW
jgi:hypothetical protein